MAGFFFVFRVNFWLIKLKNVNNFSKSFLTLQSVKIFPELYLY